MKKVEVRVELRQEVLDPQGKAILKVLHGLGYDEVCSVRAGKVFTMILDDARDGENGTASVNERVKEMAERVLANLVIEDYELSIDTETSSATVRLSSD